MSITDQHIKESLSYHCFSLIASKDGLNTDAPKYDYGVDTKISEISIQQKDDGSTRRHDNGWSIHIQLKATTVSGITESNGIITYPLRVENYNDMIQRNIDQAPNPMILILFILPDEENDWVKIDTAEEIVTQRCMYYYITSDNTLSTNLSTQTINISKDNFIKIGTLKDLFTRLKSGNL